MKKNSELLKLGAAAFSAAEAMIITSPTGEIELVNGAFTRLTGYTLDEVIGKNPRIFNSGQQSQEFYQKFWAALIEQGHWAGEVWNRRKNGEIYPQWEAINALRNSAGEITHFVGNLFDLSQQKALEDALRHLAYYDPLTKLPNRRAFLDHIQPIQRTGCRGSVILIDLSNFRHINNAQGHQIGDAIIKEVAKRLTSILHADNIVGHFGSDRFAVLLSKLADDEGSAVKFVRGIAEKIRLSLSIPIEILSNTYVLGISIGIGLFSDQQEAVDAPLKRAETALYQTKFDGISSVRFFATTMQSHVEQRVILESEMRFAIEKNQLRLYLQPQVDSEQRIVGAEALLRWQHPQRGLIPPDHFIPIAEETGLIIQMGEWVLREICSLLVQFAASGHELRLAVNVSPRQFRQPHFATRVRAILAATRANPQALTLEVTEGLAIQDMNGTILTLSILKKLGIHLSIDDFGTGYSSLAYLSKMPIDELKIDKSFLQDIPKDSRNTALVEAILAVAHHLALEVVAEGVEMHEQADFLRAHSCTYYQGYLYGKPQPVAEFLKLLS